MKTINKTWKDVLKEKGFDENITDSFIGFISWHKGEMYSNLGEKISNVLSDYSGDVIAKDVFCSIENDEGLIFMKKEISENVANEIFETITIYEENLYDN